MYRPNRNAVVAVRQYSLQTVNDTDITSSNAAESHAVRDAVNMGTSWPKHRYDLICNLMYLLLFYGDFQSWLHLVPWYYLCELPYLTSIGYTWLFDVVQKALTATVLMTMFSYQHVQISTFITELGLTMTSIWDLCTKQRVLVSDVVEKTSTRCRSRIPCVVVEKITTHRREGVGVIVEKNKVNELLTKILAISLQQ